MMTFSEALVQLKAGQDLRIRTWPRGMFLRAACSNAGSPSLVVHLHDHNPSTPSTSPYAYLSAEVFGQDWVSA